MTDHALRVQASLSSTGYSMSPTKKSNSNGLRSSLNGLKIPGMVLKLNPTLSPKSDLAHRFSSGQLSASQDGTINSARSLTGTSSSLKKKTKKNKKNGKDDSPTKNKLRTASLFNPSRSSLTLLGQSQLNTIKHQPSETVLQRFDDMRQTRDEKRKMGIDVFDSLNQRKEIERQVDILESRIRRLQIEENEMVKKINDTTDKTEKILDVKRRHQEDLFNRFMSTKNHNNGLDKKRQEINKEREDHKTNLREAMLGNYKNKHDVAYSIKMENNYGKVQKEEKHKETMEKNKTTIKKINETHNDFINTKLTKETEMKETNNSKYVTRLENEKNKTEELNTKYKELERLEQQLLEKLSSTYSVHQAKIQKLEKVFNYKVTATQPVNIGDDDEENGVPENKKAEPEANGEEGEEEPEGEGEGEEEEAQEEEVEAEEEEEEGGEEEQEEEVEEEEAEEEEAEEEEEPEDD